MKIQAIRERRSLSGITEALYREYLDEGLRRDLERQPEGACKDPARLQ